MKVSAKKDEYPSVDLWNYVTVEGYCMLNTEYGMCSSRYNYELKPDGSLSTQKEPTVRSESDPRPFPRPFPRQLSTIHPTLLHWVPTFCLVRTGSSREKSAEHQAPYDQIIPFSGLKKIKKIAILRRLHVLLPGRP